MKNMELWNRLKQPPESALKKIGGGRLKGMTDISPQWRYKIMTETFGPCGIGWKYELRDLTTQESNEEICAFATIALFIKIDDKWSEPIPGIGGSKIAAKEKSGVFISDEAFKMAVTDALSVAMKMIGVGADIYMGLWDGSKYINEANKNSEKSDLNNKAGQNGNAASGDKPDIITETKMFIQKYVDANNDFETLWEKFKTNIKELYPESAMMKPSEALSKTRHLWQQAIDAAVLPF